MKKALVILWIFVIGACVTLFFFPRLSKYYELKRMEEKVSLQVEELRQKIKDLEKEEYLIRNDLQHLERVMREELRLVKPGEIVYKVLPAVDSAGSSTESGSTKTAVSAKAKDKE